MKLFEMKNWELRVSEEAWGLIPFSKILERDDTEEKEIANKEVLFVYFWCDIKSDYLQIDPAHREEEIKKDIALPDNWVKDEVIDAAIKLYETRSVSVVQKLYRQMLKAASDVGDYLENTDDLLAERDSNGRPVTDINKVTAAIEKAPKIMEQLNKAYKEVVKEQEDLENKRKGSRAFNVFESGLNIEE